MKQFTLPSRRGGKTEAARLAVILWNITRHELQTGDNGPGFYSYADGKQEPMPFHKQDAKFKTFWRRRAGKVLQAIQRKPSPKRGRRK